MKVVIDARLYGLHHRGLGRYLIELVNGLAASESANHYVLLIDPIYRDNLPALPPNITTIDAPYRVYSLAEQLFLPALIRKISPDLVHWPHFSAPYFCPAPFVLTIHDLILHHAPSERASRLPGLFYWLKVLAYRVLISRLIKKAKNIITVSQTVADDVVGYYPSAQGKIQSIHLAPSSLPSPEFLPIKNPFILMVGAAYPHKNLEKAIAAVHIVRRQYPNLELRLVGRLDFFANKLISWVRAQGYQDWVIFMNQISDAQLVGLYKKCQAYCLYSLQEGFGFGLVEAATAGAPIVASDIPVAHEVIAGGAIYADHNDPNSLAQALINVMEPKIKQEILRSAAIVVASYSWQKTINKTLAVYLKTIDE